MATSSQQPLCCGTTRVGTEDPAKVEALDRVGWELFLRTVLAFRDAVISSIQLLQLTWLLSPATSSAPPRPRRSCLPSLLPQPRLRPRQPPRPLQRRPSSSPATAASASETEFWEQHERVSIVALAALASYSERRGKKYRLHSICGVNEHVRELPGGGDKPSWVYSHINFLVTQRGRKFPTLFFAEYDNDGGDIGSLQCCPVQLELAAAGRQVRCIYCEKEGAMIVHPADHRELLVAADVERLLLGETPYTNDGMNTHAISR